MQLKLYVQNPKATYISELLVGREELETQER